MIIVDPDRDISQYTDFAGAQRARISGIFLTHTHSDFVGGHSALAKHTGAPILAHPGMPSSFASQEIKEGNLIYCGEARIFVLETPGHTEDSLSFCIQNQTGKTFAILVGDTFDISHFHQPQPVNSIQDDILTKESRCHRMYRSIQDKIMKHNTRTLLFPAHTVMGMKVFSVADQLYGHQGIAKLQLDSFSQLLDSHGQDVRKHRYTGIQLNSNELCTIPEQLARIPFFYDYHKLPKDKLVVDCRKSLDRATYYITESVNIPLDDHFVESLGSIVGHNEQWYAIAQNEQQARLLVAQAATIGYDQ